MTPGKESEILVVQCARLGDLVQTLPILRSLKEAHAPCRLSLLYDSQYREFVRTFDAVDRHLPLDVPAFLGSPSEQAIDPGRIQEVTRWLQPLREQPFDLVCNLNYSQSSAILGAVPLTGRRRGFELDPSTRRIRHQGWFTYLVALTHHRKRNGFNLTEIFMRGAGIEPDAGSLFPARREHPRTGWVGIQVGASEVKKQWDPDFLAQVADEVIRRTSASVCLFGYGREKEIVGTVRAASRYPDRIRMDVDTSADRLGSALQAMELLITPDTGPMHLAALSGVPTLALFTGSSYCIETAPWTESTVLIQVLTEKNPCADAEPCCPNAICRQAVTPSFVGETAESVLRELRRGEDPRAVVSALVPPKDVVVVAPSFAGGTLSYRSTDGACPGDETEFFKRFWISVLGPEAGGGGHGLGDEAGEATLDTARMLFRSLPSLGMGGRPEEEEPRLERNLEDLKSRFPEFSLMFDFYGLQKRSGAPFVHAQV